ncbi:hypothetical protein [Aquimarina sp. AU474]|uniref:hypothetical protein n=1 Tax=Aquimarina sp. AU474 TaxID=2108529 RepID=UPI000D698E2E|nr:hypothetical protein [Aquimarina sp. AU474]
MSWKINKRLIRKHVLDFGTVHFYENFIIVEVKEGVILNFEKAAQMFMLGKEYYGKKTPFVYISNRIHSYSFEPTSHFKSSELFPNLKGVAVVTYSPINSNVAELEQSFLKKPSAIFHSLEEAIIWAEQLIIPD